MELHQAVDRLCLFFDFLLDVIANSSTFLGIVECQHKDERFEVVFSLFFLAVILPEDKDDFLLVLIFLELEE